MLSSATRRFAGRLHPAQVIFATFSVAVAAGVASLMIPFATHKDGGASFMESFFTAISAICVTGLTTVDTATYWTPFGQVIIVALIQLGGLGVMTIATLIGYSVLGKISFKTRLTAASEVKSNGLDDVRALVANVVRISFTIEAIVALILAARFWLGYGEPLGRALWLGVFHAISSFNNAGFALFSDNLMSYATDPWLCLPIAAAIVLGGLGFPVFVQLRRYARDRKRWSMNTKLVLAGTAFLLAIGTVWITVLEWSNPATLGPLAWHDKLLVGFFTSVQTRTAGFNSLDIGAMHPASWLGMDILMFIGGGPAGTAGGIKITTFLVLFFIVWTEVRGETAVTIFHKRLSRAVHRQAIAVVIIAIWLVVSATVLLMLFTPYSLDQVAFESISAFATVGLSTGITPKLDIASQLVLCFLMFIGRLGPITFASALALRSKRRLYEFPKERPIIG